MSTNFAAAQQQRPILQFGSSEAVTSVTWLSGHAGLIGAGMGLKYIRIYDTRADPNAATSQIVISTRSVYGIQATIHSLSGLILVV